MVHLTWLLHQYQLLSLQVLCHPWCPSSGGASCLWKGSLLSCFRRVSYLPLQKGSRGEQGSSSLARQPTPMVVCWGHSSCREGFRLHTQCILFGATAGKFPLSWEPSGVGPLCRPSSSCVVLANCLADWPPGHQHCGKYAMGLSHSVLFKPSLCLSEM